MARNRFYLFALVLLCVVTLTGCGGGGGSTPATTTTQELTGPYGLLSGTILDPVSNAPVEGAIVSLNAEGLGVTAAPSTVRRSVNRLPLAMTVTNSVGYYRFNNVPEGNYNLSVSKDGVMGAQFAAVVRQGEETIQPPIQLTPVVTLAGTLTIDKNVVASDGMPQVLIWVLGTSLGSVPKVINDTDPNLMTLSFEISSVPVSTIPYQIRYYADGHLPQTIPVTVSATAIPDNFVVNLTAVTLLADTSSEATNQEPIAVATTVSPVVAINDTVILDGSASSDPDSDPLTYHWVQTGGFPVVLTPSGANVSFVASQASVYTFLLTVKDDNGKSSLPVSVAVSTLAQSNSAPTSIAMARIGTGVAAVSLVATLGDSIVLVGSGSTDPDGDALVYNWVQIGGPTVTFESSTMGYSLLAEDTFSVTLRGDYRFALTVSDTVGNTSMNYVSVSVPQLSVNQPPLGVAGADTTSVMIGTLVTLESVGSLDPESASLNYQWSLISGPSITLNTPTAASASFTPTLEGAYLFMLVVNDGQLSALPAFITVMANTPANVSPVPSIEVTMAGTAVTMVPPASTITLDASSSTDIDGPQALTYNWTQISGPPVVVADHTLVQATTTLNLPGTYSFKVTLFDGVTSSESVATVTVNQRPLAVANAPVVLFLNQTGTLDGGNSYDDDGDTIVSWTWTQVWNKPGSTTLAAGTNPWEKTFTPSEIGTYTFQLVVNDGTVDSLPVEKQVVVQAPPIQVANVSVNQNPPGSSDQVIGSAGAIVLGAGYQVKVFADPTMLQVLASAVTDATGAFTLTIADNSPLIRDNKMYLAIVGAALTQGPLMTLVNDTTPPANPLLSSYDSAVNALNEANYTIIGSCEPNITVTLRAKVAGTTVNGTPVAADGGGSFTASVDTSTLQEGGILLTLVLEDAAGNLNLYPVISTTRDVTPPSVTIISPANNALISAIPMVHYNIGDTVKSVHFEFTNQGDPADVRDYYDIRQTSTSAGEHNVLLNMLTPAQLVDGETYDLLVTVEDFAGNSSNFARSGLTCDTSAPTGIGVSAPGNGGTILSQKPTVSYDLSGASETIQSAYVEVLYESGPRDAHTPMKIDMLATDLTAAPHNVDLLLPFDLQVGTTYSFRFVFADAAGNQSTPLLRTGLTVVSAGEFAGLNLLKPLAATKIAGHPKVSYVLGEGVTEVRFIFDRVNGSGPLTKLEVLNSSPEIDPGIHTDVLLNSAAILVNNEDYNLTVKVLLNNGDLLQVAQVNGLKVDTVVPSLLTTTAIQAVFGKWNAGDSIAFTFNDAMDPTKLMTPMDANLRFTDGSGFAGDDWGTITIKWSADNYTVTFELLDNVFSGTPFKAHVAGNCSQISPTGLVDQAGNLIGASSNDLLSTGDTTPPVIKITSPNTDSTVAGTVAITYNLTEDLQSGTIVITHLQTGVTPNDMLQLRTWAIDPANRSAGSHTVSFATAGFPNLVDLNYYNLSISGTDFAGHQGSDQLLNLRADTTPPSAPSTMDYEYHGYANEIRSASAAGGANEFLRVYITGDPSSPYTAMYPGPYSIGDTIISGLSAPVAGRAIQYCMVKFGNESSLIADGNIPTPLTGADANLLAVEWDNAYTDYQVNASALPSTLNEGDSIYAHSSVNPTELSWVASITSMTWMMFSDAIPSASIMPGAQISYTYKDTNGNYAGFTADGKIEALQAVDVVDVNTSGFVDTGDIIRLDFGAGNNVTVNAGLGTMQSGSPAIIGGYQWSGSLGELNVSLVSPTSAAEMFANFVAPSIVSSGSQYAEINLNDFSIMSVNNIDQVAVEIHPKGTNSIRGEDGGHLVLPSSMITSNGTTGGIVTPDF